MPMTNLDTLAQQKAQIMQRLADALKGGDESAFQQAFTDWTGMVEQSVLAEAKGMIQAVDNQILASRGVRALTSEETKFYQAFIDAAKAGPKQALTNTDPILPQTIIDTIFEDIKAEHPLLGFINFSNVGMITKILASTTSGVAGWGELGATISDELAASFSEVEMTQKKLSAFIPVSNYMLDMGPAWIDRYVRAILTEAIAVELEASIVDADGKEGPLGMTRALTGAVDGVYPRKNTMTVDALDPATIGGILNTISQGPNNKRRAVPRLLMVVNPADYYTKVFPATTVRNTDGSFTSNALPYPMDVVVSPAVPANKAVFGLAKRYFFGLGSGAGKGGKLEYSDEYKFLEDYRVYRIKLYGNGRALDANAFVYADITNLKPTVQQVYVVNADEFPGAGA